MSLHGMQEVAGSSPASSTKTSLIEPMSKDPRSRKATGVLASWRLVLATRVAGAGSGALLRMALWKSRSAANGPASSALVMVSSQT